MCGTTVPRTLGTAAERGCPPAKERAVSYVDFSRDRAEQLRAEAQHCRDIRATCLETSGNSLTTLLKLIFWG